jgi:hypothetical protein
MVLIAWAHWSGQPEWAWPDQLGPAGRPLTLSLTRSCPNPNPLWRSWITDDSLAQFRRAPPPPYGAITPPHWVLPSDHGDSSTSPPFVAIASELRPVDLALEAWSALAGLAGASSRLSVLAVVPPSPRRLDDEPATPTSPLGVVLGRLAVSTMPLLAVAATGRWLHCHNRGCANSVSAMVFCLAPLWAHLWVHSFSLVSVLLSWWPGQRARHACLLLLRNAWACDAVLELLC